MSDRSGTLHVVCSECATVNRVLKARLGDGPKCAKCNKRLFTGTPIFLDEGNFDKQISRNDMPLLVDFWAQWCGPCHMMAPAFQQAAAELEPLVRFGKLDTEKAGSIAARYNIQSIPTIILFANGRETARQSGALSRDQIIQWVKSNTAG